MKILVTGASGFVGQHLLARLSSHDVVGLTRHTSPDALARLFPSVTFKTLDILDGGALEAVLQDVKPDACFHLAGISTISLPQDRQHEYFRTNVEGWLHVVEGFKRHSPQTPIVFVGSSQVYGRVDAARLPIRESEPMRPENLYSMSKGTCEWMAKSYCETQGMRIVLLRPFNHIGPGQSASFVCASMARQVAQVEAGLVEPVLNVGNLDSKRDFTDVRDIVRAYTLALDKCQTGVPYNIASGRGVVIADILERLVAMAGVKIAIKTDAKRLRQEDPSELYGDCTHFRQATGWRPEISLDKTLADTLDYWRARVKEQEVLRHAAL